MFDTIAFDVKTIGFKIQQTILISRSAAYPILILIAELKKTFDKCEPLQSLATTLSQICQRRSAHSVLMTVIVDQRTEHPCQSPKKRACTRYCQNFETVAFFWILGLTSEN